MDPNNAPSELHDIVASLFSRDPVIFNSTINRVFDGRAVYQGNGLNVSGASNIKHALWLLNFVEVGSKEARVDRVEWESSTSTATVLATRYVRPIFSPVSFAVPVTSTLRFSADDFQPNVDGEEPRELYVREFKDAWPVDSLLKSIPLVGLLYLSIWVPAATYLILTMANFAFAADSRLFSAKRRYLDAHSGFVKKRLPPNFQHGFDQGSFIGRHATSALRRIARLPLRSLEFVAQSSTRVVNAVVPAPLQLPWPFVFDESSHSPYDREGEASRPVVKKAEGKESKLPERGVEPVKDRSTNGSPRSNDSSDDRRPARATDLNGVAAASAPADDEKEDLKQSGSNDVPSLDEPTTSSDVRSTPVPAVSNDTSSLSTSVDAELAARPGNETAAPPDVSPREEDAPTDADGTENAGVNVASATEGDDVGPTDTAPPLEAAPAANDEAEAEADKVPDATVVVGPSIDGLDGTKTYSIPAHQHHDGEQVSQKELAAPATDEPETKTTVFDRIEVPDLTKDEPAADVAAVAEGSKGGDDAADTGAPTPVSTGPKKNKKKKKHGRGKNASTSAPHPTEA